MKNICPVARPRSFCREIVVAKKRFENQIPVLENRNLVFRNFQGACWPQQLPGNNHKSRNNHKSQIWSWQLEISNLELVCSILIFWIIYLRTWTILEPKNTMTKTHKVDLVALASVQAQPGRTAYLYAHTHAAMHAHALTHARTQLCP